MAICFFIVKFAKSGRCWPQIMFCGLISSRRDGEEIVLLSMPLLTQNYGNMCMRCKIVVIELDCKFEVKFSFYF